MNLCVNARDAMPQGGILTIKTDVKKITSKDAKAHLEAKEGDYVSLIVSDTGTGIKSENRTRIFDPLFTTKKVGEGTGLGLTVTYAIIKKYGGEIAFETRTKEESQESGTTFIITLPTHVA